MCRDAAPKGVEHMAVSKVRGRVSPPGLEWKPQRWELGRKTVSHERGGKAPVWEVRSKQGLSHAADVEKFKK
jgi:hypothetical protein